MSLQVRRSILRRFGPLFVFAGLLLTFSNSNLFADDENYQTYPLGEQASGMGGAYTALSESSEGTYYNPAGIARGASYSTISLSATAFRWTFGSIGNAIALSPTRRANYRVSAIQFLPTSTAYLKKLKEGRVVGFSLYLQDASLFTGRNKIENVFFSQRLSNQMLWIGPSFGQAINDRLMVGAGIYLLNRDFVREVYVRSEGATVSQQFQSTDVTYRAILPLLGVKYDLTPELKLGATLRPYYSIRLAGSGEIHINNNTSETILSGLKIDSPTPIRGDFGVAWQVPGRWTISGDASINLPHTFVQVHDPQGRFADAKVRQEWTFNGAVGTEYYLGRSWPIRFGVFTDLSSAPSLKSSDPNIVTRIDFLGTTASIGYLTEHSTIAVGAQYSHGFGKATNPVGDPQGFTLSILNLFFAGSYRF